MENVWQYDKFTRGVGPVSQDDDQSYGMVLPIAYVEFDEDESVQLRNAKLIAAAPQMLKALRRCESALSNIPLPVEFVNDLLNARDIIEKVTK